MRDAQEAIQGNAFLTPPVLLSAKPNVRMLLTTAAEIASGMAFLHSRGIIHGDLSGGQPPPDIPHLSAIISCRLASCHSSYTPMRQPAPWFLSPITCRCLSMCSADLILWDRRLVSRALVCTSETLKHAAP